MSPDAAETLGMLLESADAFLSERHALNRLRVAHEVRETVVEPGIWRKMAELGWLGMVLPEAIGGLDIPLACGAALCERLGRSLLPEPLIASALMPGILLAACPPSEARDAMAASLGYGETAVTIAWQEGPDPFAEAPLRTVLSEGSLTGTKSFVPLSLPQTTLLVLAEDEGEPVLIVVDAEAAGVGTRRFRMGDGSCSVELTLDHVAVAGAPLARGAVARGAFQAALNAGMLALSAQLTGLAEGALSLSLDYLRTRSQFGNPIGAFQTLQHRAVDLYLLVELARASWRHAARLHETQPNDPAALAAISAAKAAAVKAARSTSQAGIQFFGAMGFTDEADIGLYLRSALQWGAWLGGDTAHRRRFYTLSHQASGA